MSFDFTLAIHTSSGQMHVVAFRFKSSHAAELFEVDQYDDCRLDAQEWLNRHYPGERLRDDGDDIENCGGESEFPDDVLDFTSR